MTLPSVFVEIPSQNANLSTAKIASASRPGEIKAEPPIKSEIDHANHSQSLATQRATDAICPIPSTSSQYTPAATGSKSKLTSNLVTARPKLKCLKCDECPFMSISRQGFDEHIRSVHKDSANSTTRAKRNYRNKLLCPGCDNVFYSRMSLKIHLVNDHQMNRKDIKQLLDSVLVEQNLRSVAQQPTSTPSVDVRQYETQKIYLKNVEVLQNPKFTAQRLNADTVHEISSAAVDVPGASENLPDNLLALDNENFELRATMVRYEPIECDNTFEHQHVEPLPIFSFVSPSLSPQTNVGLHINNGHHSEPVILNAIPSINPPPTVDDPNGLRPSTAQQAWMSNTAANTNFNYVEFSTALDVNTMSSESVANAPTTSSDQSEQKKIFIKNIDILMKPILHLRTVDEVNLLINKVSFCIR